MKCAARLRARKASFQMSSNKHRRGNLGNCIINKLARPSPMTKRYAVRCHSERGGGEAMRGGKWNVKKLEKKEN